MCKKTNSSSVEKLSSFMLGLGTLLVGIAACVGIYKSSDVMNAIADLKTAINDVKIIVDGIDERTKEITSEEIITMPSIKNPNSTSDAISRALKAYKEKPNNVKHEKPFIRNNDFSYVVDKLEKTKSIDERKKIIKKYLKTEKGDFISTEDGDKLQLE